MSFEQFFLVMRARYRIVGAVFIFVVTTVSVLTISLPDTYKATTVVIPDYKGADPITGSSLPGQTFPGYMAIQLATQVEMLKSITVAESVVDDLKLTESQDWKRQYDKIEKNKPAIRTWIALSLLRQLNVEPSHDSNVIRISVKDRDPNRAAHFANAFATAYQKLNLQLAVEPSKQAAAFLNNQKKKLQRNLEDLQQKLSQHQQETGIFSLTGPDVELARLNDLSSQLVTAQNQLIEASSRRKQALGRAADSPDVNNNPLIQRLKSDISTAESKLALISENFTREHPRYQAVAAEVNMLRASLNEQTKIASRSIDNNAEILSRREAELKTAVLSQKDRVLSYNRQRDQFLFLRQQIEDAQRAYDAAVNRMNANDLQGRVDHSNVSILSEAVAPTQPIFPLARINISLSIFIGILLGVGAAIFIEIVDRRVRSPREIIQIFGTPVFGVISDRGKSRFEGRLLLNSPLSRYLQKTSAE